MSKRRGKRVVVGYVDVAGPAYHEKFVALFEGARALRAHREKVGK